MAERAGWILRPSASDSGRDGLIARLYLGWLPARPPPDGRTSGNEGRNLNDLLHCKTFTVAVSPRAGGDDGCLCHLVFDAGGSGAHYRGRRGPLGNGGAHT